MKTILRTLAVAALALTGVCAFTAHAELNFKKCTIDTPIHTASINMYGNLAFATYEQNGEMVTFKIFEGGLDNPEEEVTFTVKSPGKVTEGYNAGEYYRPFTNMRSLRQGFMGGSETINEVIATKHLFNSDDLYEVMFVKQINDENVCIVMNQNGEILGEIPEPYGYRVDGGKYLYFDHNTDYPDNYDNNGGSVWYITDGNDVNSIPAEIVPNDENLYNLKGQRVNSTNRGEIYLKGAKKFIATEKE